MKIITDRTGKTIAFENEVSGTRREIRSRTNDLLAWYDPRTNQTFSRNGAFVGNGDQRARFIPAN